jgi:ribonuclease P protein component
VVVQLLLLAEPKAVLASQFSINQSLPSRCRIRQRKDFELALKNSGLINKWFAVHLVNTANGYARLGMVVSKRTMPKAVARNFAKRLIRECFRQNLTVLPALDFVIRIRRNLTQNTSLEARTALIALLLAAKA